MTGLRAGAMAWLAVCAGQAVLADDFRAAPSITLMSSSNNYRASAPTLSASTAPSVYQAAAPRVRAVTLSDGYRAQAPVLRAVIRSDGYRASAPTLRATTETHRFRAAAPGFQVVLQPDGYMAAAPPLRAVVGVHRYAAIAPSLTAHAQLDQDQDRSRTIASDLLCSELVQCFAEGDIRVVEDDMTRLGYTPETYASFCADVAQSLGDCPSVAATSSSGGFDDLTENLMAHGATSETFHLFRCIPLEDYAIDLQRRTDAGEDTDAEERSLEALVADASVYVISGRTDLWCDHIASRLP
ncbi:hypothetical protein [uncultured Tateyamaria sp.]|uniref:hypothetical protein n=1 Tax=Tateyamaria sp. 1078 TaxID=3417464 RepID=UPI0026228B72|nr:hypothetical protein [uncultured Tateyamaria sp.]